MSDFAVRIERIKAIYPHSNADRLEIGELEGIGYRFCIPKGEYSIGELVVYFPIDSLLPDNLISILFPDGSMLAGKDKNRVKTIKLRGEISQGLIVKLDILDKYENFGIIRNYKDLDNEHLMWHHKSWLEFGKDCLVSNKYELQLGFDLTNLLGVTKYEPSPETNSGGNKGNLPFNLHHYDIENAERYAHFVERLMDEPVYISEKLEGQQTNLVMYKDGSIKIASRNFERELDKSNNWGHGWLNSGIIEKLNEIYGYFIFEYAGEEIESVALRGELVGTDIQGNIYKFPDRKIFLFEIEINGIPIDAKEFLVICDEYELPSIPELNKYNQTLEQFLRGKSLAEVSNSPTTLYYYYPEYVPMKQLREGIVIKPMQEIYYNAKSKEFFYKHDLEIEEIKNLQRVVVKQRSPLYLAGEKD